MFGEFLIKKNMATHSQVTEGIKLQKYAKKKLGRLMVQLGYFSQERLNEALHLYFRPKSLYMASKLKGEIPLIPLIPHEKSLEHIAKKYKALLINSSVRSDRVEFISTTLDDTFIEKAETLSQREAFVWIVTQEVFDFLKAKAQAIRGEKPHALAISRALSDDGKISGNSPYAKLVKECIDEAQKREASDIHFAPRDKGIDISFRLNGQLTLWKSLSRDHREALISKVKEIVNMELGLVGCPQDSRASFHQWDMDIRANSLPFIHGEKIVLRLLKRNQNFNLAQAGLSEQTLIHMRRAIIKRNGLILISGPTGSGKTTTLYSLLHEIDWEQKNISTLENPVEYQFSGINQVNIGNELTFADSLRALMRQDPDVILVGEIRDRETAKLCFHAAETGHLVLSTVHANGAIEVVERLKNLGVSPLSIKSNLCFSASQRLVRKVCPHCSIRISKTLSEEIQIQFSHMKSIDFSTFRIPHEKKDPPCLHCTAGMSGRKAILEYIQACEINAFLSESENLPFTSLKDMAFIDAQNSEIDARELLEIA